MRNGLPEKALLMICQTEPPDHVFCRQDLSDINGVRFEKVGLRMKDDTRQLWEKLGEKALLRASEFRWDSQQRIWWKYDDAA